MPTSNRPFNIRPSAVLPAAGAYDVAPLSFTEDQGVEITFYFDYTRGGVGGAFQYKIETSIDGINWYQEASVQEVVIAAGSDLVALTQRVSVSYTATSASKESFVSSTFTVAANWIRINVKETGNVGAPGTLNINAYVRIDF